MSPPERPLRVGYVVKRFPRTSETFIAQEILELERRGVDVCVFALHENDQPARHAWLSRLRAQVIECKAETLRGTWEWLHSRLAGAPALAGRGVQRALGWAAEYPHGRRDIGQCAALVQAAEFLGVDRLHAHFANRPAAVSLLANAVSGIPFSFTAHAKDIFATGPPLATWRRLARRADFIATVSESNRRHLIDLLGARWAPKVCRVYNGVDLEAIQPGPSSRGFGPLRLVCVARLVPKKGLGDLLEAASLLRARGVAFECSIVGDGPEREALLRARDALGLGDCVDFTGALGHERVIAKLSQADAVVLPCRVESNGDRDVLPTALLEGMAAGRACISTRVGGVPEIVVHGETGLLVPERSPTSLADAVEALAADRDRMARMGSAGRRRAEALFDRRRTVELLHRCFQGESPDSATEAAPPATVVPLRAAG